MGNPASRGQQRDKPLRDALRIEAALAEKGEESPAKEPSLRYLARQLLIRAGKDTASFREVADRLDGKVPQGLEHDGSLTLRHEDALAFLEGDGGETPPQE